MTIIFEKSPTAVFGLGYHPGEKADTKSFSKELLQKLLDGGFAKVVKGTKRESAKSKQAKELG